MRGDLGSLYDAHAARLYAYCWSLVGDERAAAAVRDTFVAAVHQPPRGDTVLWLYSLARTTCTGPGAVPAGRAAPLFSGSDPLLRAAAGLRSDHREVLLLWAGEWLEPHDIARVLGIAPDTLAQLLDVARARLERAVLDTLMRGTAYLDLITAFEKGRLPRLLAGRAPERAPAWLREQVLAACEDEAVRALPTVAAPTPLVVIAPGRTERPPRRRGVSRGAGAVAGLAASAAAVVGLLASWPSAKGGDAASLVPTSSTGHTEPASTLTGDGQGHPPGVTGSERGTHTPVTTAYGDPPRPVEASPGGGTSPGSPGSPGAHRAPARSAPAPRASHDPSTAAPSKPGTPPATPPKPPTTPPGGSPDPTTPPGGGTDPTTPPQTPTDPPGEEPGTPGPSPTSNPAPSPGQG
ncbi:RNA polymerase sigma factor [Actinomadura sp. NEAU-AAG7]|uniref:RNA polymerase sigma factor n=1 Tax=Actinomadura sp. NEAU-AAG7 TaxID=2839640 RepID=UPI001BE3F43A|nr:hypothetical protein [Actinomadura sp. NEAU-AAG7]MBT2208350.1 hypothetical protein [Actinomadura sp. NEAU-AAG7]